MSFVNEQGLQTLIKLTQGKIIKKKEFEDVSAKGDVYVAEIFPFYFDQPWHLLYRITVNVPEDVNATQFAIVSIGGIKSEITYYTTQTTIYDIGRRSAEMHSFDLLTKSGYISANGHLMGLRTTSLDVTRNISIEFYDIVGCDVRFRERAQSISDIEIGINDYYMIDRFKFSDNGFFAHNVPERDELSEVAFSGSYEDLLDKPDIMDVSYDLSTDEEIVFIYK